MTHHSSSPTPSPITPPLPPPHPLLFLPTSSLITPLLSPHPSLLLPIPSPITPLPPPSRPSLLYFPTAYSIITLKNLPEVEGGDSLQTQKEERKEGRCTTSTTRQVEMKTAVILRRATQGPVD